MIYAERLKYLRISKGITQKELCEDLKNMGYDIKRNTYTRYESGQRSLPNNILIALSVYYKTSADFILGLTDCTEPYIRNM